MKVENPKIIFNQRMSWSFLADALSLLWLGTALHALLVQWYYGQTTRIDISSGLEALALPFHALWIAAIVLAHSEEEVSTDDHINGRLEQSHHRCWTRRILSFPPLLALGDISLSVYCLHLPVLYVYASLYAWVTTNNGYLYDSMEDIDMRVSIPWYRAPLQWILILWVSSMTFTWYEAPLRKWLVSAKNGPGILSQSVATIHSGAESQALLASSESSVKANQRYDRT